MGYLVFWLTRLVIAFFWLLPFRLLHGLSDVLVFVLHDVVRYRRRVVYDNLRRVYPDIQEGELGKLARLTYRNMSDVLLETLKSFTLSPESIRARCVCVDSSVVNSFLNSGQSVLVSGSHLCNWEWACLSIPFGISGRAVTIYKPLSNRFFDAYFNNKRRRGGMNLVNMDEVYGQMLREREPTAWYLLSDQSPSSRRHVQWTTFLGQDSAMLSGLDVLSRRFNYPVLYFSLERLRRGYYLLRYEVLCAEPVRLGVGDVTAIYAARSSKAIDASPSDWLWSHRRWKMTR